MYTHDYDVQSMRICLGPEKQIMDHCSGRDGYARVYVCVPIHVSCGLISALLFDYHKKRTTGNDNNGVITSRLPISSDYDLEDVTQMLYSSLIPSSRSG